MKKVIKIITTTLLSSILLISFLAPLSNQAKAGWWGRDSNGWWYSWGGYQGQYYKNKMQMIDLKLYHFDERGYMTTGWHYDKKGNQWYYFDPVSGAAKSGWLYSNGKWYMLILVMITGYYYDADAKKHYYLDPVNGDMKTGWKKLKVGINKESWYYFDPVTGAAAENTWKHINGKWYYFYSAAAEGFGFVGKKKYYFDPINCDMKTGWINVNGDKYYADPNDGGALATNKTLRIGGVSYTFDGAGRLIKK